MPGPDPSPTRRRRNVPEKVKSLVVLPVEGRRGTVPKPRTDRPLLPASREMWKALWRSPQATQWNLATAVYPLTRLVVLFDMQEREMQVDKGMSAEMRALEKAYGLNAEGMKALNWTIGKPENPATPSRSPEPPVGDEVAARRARRDRVARAAGE
jgi:hypothetical protein